MKLRALLGSFGLADGQIDVFVSSDASGPSIEQPLLRNIRPKLQLRVAPEQTAFVAGVRDMNDPPLSVVSEPTSSTMVSSTSSSCCGSTCPPTHPKTEGSSTAIPSAPNFPQPHFCDAFLAYFEPTQGPSGENSIRCSEARDLIDQYNVGGQDIQHISYRLAAGFEPGINPRECCRVNARLLFEVLDDISSGMS
jgi:hypothetical protein